MFFLEVAADVVQEVAEIATEAATTLAYNAHDLMKLEDESIIGRLIFGLKVTGFGMAVVFVILILLWGILELFGVIVASVMKNNKTGTVVESAAEIPEPVAEAIESEPSSDYPEENGVLIAVLTAAIVEYNKANETVHSDGEENKGFRIVSFKERNKVI